MDGIADDTGCLRVVVSYTDMATACTAEYRAGGYSTLCDSFVAGCILQVPPLWSSIPQRAGIQEPLITQLQPLWCVIAAQMSGMLPSFKGT